MINASEIITNLWQGGYPPIGTELAYLGFKGLVITAAERDPYRNVGGAPDTQRSDDYPGVSLFYSPTWDLPIDKATLSAAKSSAQVAAEWMRDGKKVLVTCGQGWNRSGLVVGLTLHLLKPTALGTDIVKLIQSKRQGALSNQSFREVIERLK